jgi:phosphoribosylaminoimidazole-succinocarboxamide synthase
MTTSITSLPLLARGKVRDNYAVGDDRILMVATDRLSAFDVVMNQGVPGKGKILTELALFWFKRLEHIIPNHLTGEDPLSVVTPAERDQIRGRAMLVKRLKPIPVEAVVRGYLAGSAWKEYEREQSACGMRLPAGLKNSSKLPDIIFTPAIKAKVGEHDENIGFDQMVELIGDDLAHQVRAASINLYNDAAIYASTKGLIIADTKFEFGIDRNGQVVLMDEILTPDSSRYWPSFGYSEEFTSFGYDKQFFRNWLELPDLNGVHWNKKSPPPFIPSHILERIINKYDEVTKCLVR